MSDKEVQESQKTVVAFIAGLLVGGLLVWMFQGDAKKVEAPEKNADEQTEEMNDEATNENDETASDTPVVPELPVGEGSATVPTQAAGSLVTLESATFPTEEGWVAVRSYTNGEFGSILGAIAYSKTAGRVPTSIPLVAPTTAGKEYAIVFFSQDGNRAFNPGGDVQLQTPLITFKAE